MDSSYSLKHLKSNLEFHVESNSILIGRSANCDFQVDKETLSREHARLALKAGELVMQDLHSTNGTFVNEQQIHEATQVRPGDVIRFGQEAFCLQGAAADATQMFDRNAADILSSAMLVADDEEEDGTVMLQAISLPPGWEAEVKSTPATVALNSEDKGLITALKAHARKKLSHSFGLLVTIIDDHAAPSVKLLSTEKSGANWQVGRNASAAIVLADARVSDIHALFAFENKEWKVQDQQSRNGTFVHGSRVTEIKVNGNLELAIGPYTLLLETITKA